MKKIIIATILGVALVSPLLSFASPLTQTQAESLISVVQSSPKTPASAFTNLITTFSNITEAQADSLIGVVQAAPGTPASVFINLLVAFTQGTQPNDTTTTQNTLQPIKKTTQAVTPQTSPVSQNYCNGTLYPQCVGGKFECLSNGQPSCGNVTALISPAQIVSPQTSQQSQTYPTQQLDDALSSVYTQLALNSVKTTAPNLATIAGMEQSRLTILQNVRTQCTQAYTAAEQQQQQQNRIALDNVMTSRGLATNSALLAQQQMLNDYRIKNLQDQESAYETSYPTVSGGLSAQIDSAVHQLAALYTQVQAGQISDIDAISILQQYNSLESEIYAFNSEIPSPSACPAFNISIPNISSNIGAKPQPVYFGGTITCTEQGDNKVNCSDGTSCIAVGMNVLNCSGPGPSVSCQGNFTGGKVTCSY